MRFVAVMFIWCASAGFAHAETELRGELFCFPAKDVPKIIDALADVDMDRRDVVDVSVEPRFLIKDEGTWPDRFFIRTETAEIDVPIQKPSGQTPAFIDAARAHKDGDICVADKARADRPKYDEGLYFEMGLSPHFHNRSGEHALAELEEGAKDGKKFYKKMIPAAVRLFMPDTDYLAVQYSDFRTNDAQVFAKVGDQEVPLQTELYKDLHVVSLDTLEDMDASALIIKGGSYRLLPTVSVKTMRKFGFGQDEEN
ncbi:hypothetical protein ACJ3XI_02415 [Litorimonas sp. RW-G-Af-16]|uniref:hypothetical protein n=1 Tax=Litorimonas sp. RW-G-Af-16 TaxID=3241168 RepID=UPI00390CA484